MPLGNNAALGGAATHGDLATLGPVDPSMVDNFVTSTMQVEGDLSTPELADKKFQVPLLDPGDQAEIKKWQEWLQEDVPAKGTCGRDFSRSIAKIPGDKERYDAMSPEGILAHGRLCFRYRFHITVMPYGLCSVLITFANTDMYYGDWRMGYALS